MKKTYVYLIRCEGFVKIGNAHNPEQRMKDMQVGNPYELELIAKMPFDSKRAAHSYEMELHHRLRKHQIRGEWFAHKGVNLAMRAPHRSDEKKTKRTPKDERWQEEPLIDKAAEMKLVSECPFEANARYHGFSEFRGRDEEGRMQFLAPTLPEYPTSKILEHKDKHSAWFYGVSKPSYYEYRSGNLVFQSFVLTKPNGLRNRVFDEVPCDKTEKRLSRSIQAHKAIRTQRERGSLSWAARA